jgi:hypothetical protein
LFQFWSTFAPSGCWLRIFGSIQSPARTVQSNSLWWQGASPAKYLKDAQYKCTSKIRTRRNVLCVNVLYFSNLFLAYQKTRRTRISRPSLGLLVSSAYPARTAPANVFQQHQASPAKYLKDAQYEVNFRNTHYKKDIPNYILVRFSFLSLVLGFQKYF